MDKELFAAALGLSEPWFVEHLEFDASAKKLTIEIDFVAGARFLSAAGEGPYPVHDTRTKRYRHLNFFQHECYLEVRVPRIKLPDSKVTLVEPPWAGQLSGFTLLFEAMVIMLCREMTFAAVSRLVGLSWHRVNAICARYVERAQLQTDWSEVTEIAIDETSRQRGQDYVTVVADASERKIIFVDEGHGSHTIEHFAAELGRHGSAPGRITSVSIDMSPAYIRGVAAHLPAAQITFDKYHVIANASKALDRTRIIEQRSDASLKGMRWTILKDRSRLSMAQRADLDALLGALEHKRTARAWQYREQLRAILNCKQPNVMRAALLQWCTNVNRSKVEPMKRVVAMVRSHIEGIVAMARSRQTNGFIEALNGLFQAAKRKARGYSRMSTIKTVLFLIAGKLDYSKLNQYVAVPT